MPYFINKGIIRRNRVNLSIILFFILFAFLHYIKPALVYDNDGSFRQFGLGYKHKTVTPVWLFAIVFAILSYVCIRYIERQ
jgi:hypothetical protein